MGSAADFSKEKLMCGILFNDSPGILDGALEALRREWGPTDFESESEPFIYSSYYNEEMGAPPNRVFVSFATLVDPGLLADIKHRTNDMEREPASALLRPVNLDPGLISAGRLALATTKNAGHRMALSRGIYVEMTLYYSRGEFRPLPWTYPDFQSERVRDEMETIRSIYIKQLKSGGA